MNAGAAADHAGLDALMNVALDVSVELGRRAMTLSEILRTGTGSIIELNRPAGAPVDVFVAGTAIARGEIVAVGDNFGVRVTELIGRAARTPRV